MTALVSIRCDTELDDGSFCISAKVSGAATSVAWLKVSALRSGWTQDGARHYCPTCTDRRGFFTYDDNGRRVAK